MARPTLPEGRRRSRVIALRLTQREYDALRTHFESQQLRRSAQGQRLRFGSFVRRLVIDALCGENKFARAKLRG
jgi:hypothetical protein